MGFIEKNEKERMDFVDFWSNYVLRHSDRVWSKQQNIIINSCLKSAGMSGIDYLNMKRKP